MAITPTKLPCTSHARSRSHKQEHLPVISTFALRLMTKRSLQHQGLAKATAAVLADAQEVEKAATSQARAAAQRRVEQLEELNSSLEDFGAVLRQLDAARADPSANVMRLFVNGMLDLVVMLEGGPMGRADGMGRWGGRGCSTSTLTLLAFVVCDCVVLQIIFDNANATGVARHIPTFNSYLGQCVSTLCNSFYPYVASRVADRDSSLRTWVRCSDTESVRERVREALHMHTHTFTHRCSLCDILPCLGTPRTR